MAVPERGLEELAGRCRLQGPELGEWPGRKGLRITLRGPLLKLGCEDVEVGYPPPPPQWPVTQGQMERTVGLESGSVSTWPGKVPLSAQTQALLPPWYCLASGHCVLSAWFL